MIPNRTYPELSSPHAEDPPLDLPRDPVTVSVQDASGERAPRVRRATAGVEPDVRCERRRACALALTARTRTRLNECASVT